MKKLIMMLALLGCSGGNESQSLIAPPFDGDAAAGATPPRSLDSGTSGSGGSATVDMSPPGSGGVTMPVVGGGGAITDGPPATDDRPDAESQGHDTAGAPDARAVGMDAREKVDGGGGGGDAPKLVVVVQPGAMFTGDVQEATAMLAKRCEGLGNADGKPCEIGVKGFGFVMAKCSSHFCCPGCWDGKTCLVTITPNTANSSVSDVACGSRGSLCMACPAPQACKQMAVEGGTVVTGCQN
jgi:hypothetical protein